MNSPPSATLTRFAPLILLAVGGLVYANSLSVPFIYDDFGAIVDNADIRRLWPPRWALPSSAPNAPTNSRPVVAFTLALNYAFGGSSVTGYRLLNIAVHILCACTLYAVARRTLLTPSLASRFGPVAPLLALAGALLWLVHPLGTQCVDYTIQRSESLMALFYLLALYGAIRHIETGRPIWIVVAVATCAFGMASKEAMVTAPILILLYDRTYAAGSFATAWYQRKFLYIGLASTWFLLALLMSAASHGSSIGFTSDVTILDYALNQSWVILNYLKKAVWPHPLIVDYGYPLPLTVGDVLPQLLLLATLLGFTVVALFRWPTLAFPAAWFFLILVPTSSIVPIVNEVGAERRAYLPLAGLILLAVVAGHLLLCRLRWPAWAGLAVLLILVTAFGLRTTQRNAEYRDPLTLWQTAVDAVPHNPRAHTYLGLALKERGRSPEAAQRYQRALQIDPNYSEAHANLGILLAEAGQFDRAIAHFRQSLKAYPDHPEVHNNLGNALLSSGRLDLALPSFNRALELRPHYADAHSNLGILLGMQGRTDEAVSRFHRALEHDPTYARAHFNLGITYMNTSDSDKAVHHFRQALRLQPDFPQARHGLENALRQQGKP